MIYIVERFVIMQDILNQHYEIKNSSGILNSLWGVMNW